MIKFVLQFIIFLAAAALPLKELFPHRKKSLAPSIYLSILFTLFLLTTYAMVQEDKETTKRINESRAQNKILLDLLTENKLESKTHGHILVETQKELKAVRGTLSSIELKDKNMLNVSDTALKELSEASLKLKRSEERLRNIYPRVVHDISIKDGRFEPDVVDIESGQFLSFTNNDKLTHFIKSKEGGLDFFEELLPAEKYAIYIYAGKMTFDIISRDQPNAILRVNVLE